MPTIDEIKAWQGGTVTDRDGEKIGSIDEVYVDRDSGEPEWLAVKTGLFGDKLSFVPVAEAAPAGEQVRVPYEKAQVKNAPQVDADGELSETEETDLYRHYGLEHDRSRSDSGTARLRKYIVTDKVKQTVPVEREVTDEVRKEQIDAVRKAARR